MELFTFSEASNPEMFFRILPKEWNEELMQFWEKVSATSSVYILSTNDTVVGGGIAFSEITPDMMYNEPLAKNMFLNGYLYLGFIYIDEKLQGKGLGKMLLKHIISKDLQQKFWLTIEDYSLTHFYESVGFVLKDELDNSGSKEWLMVKN